MDEYSITAEGKRFWNQLTDEERVRLFMNSDTTKELVAVINYEWGDL